MLEEQKKSKFRKCYEPHLRDYPDCFEECGCDTCESPLASQIDKIYSQPPEGLREKIRTSMPIVHCENYYLHKARSDSIKKQFQEPL